MNIIKSIVVVLILALCNISIFAQSTSKIEAALQELSQSDGKNGARVEVIQSEEITKRLAKHPVAVGEVVRGYRVQVYSSNNGQTARSRAFAIERNILREHPAMEVSVTYTSPFWKVRVGVCRTHEEAQQLKEYLIECFPEFKTTCYIVQDNISGK